MAKMIYVVMFDSKPNFAVKATNYKTATVKIKKLLKLSKSQNIPNDYDIHEVSLF